MLSQEVALLAILIAIGSLPWTEASPVRNPRSQGATNGTLALPNIIYGPVNHQLGNQYPSADPARTESNSSASVVYGSTNLQTNNKYVTIAHAGHVYLLIPTINGAQDNHADHVPAVANSQNDKDEGFFFNANDPAVKDMEEFIEEYNSYQLTFNRLVHLGGPFLIENEMTSSLREEAKGDSARQILETEWLAEAVKHKLKLMELHGMITSMYDKLASKAEVTSAEHDAVREELADVRLSEDAFLGETEDFVINII